MDIGQANASMISHLKNKYILLNKKLKFRRNDNILDIGVMMELLNFFPLNTNRVGFVILQQKNLVNIIKKI